MAYDEQKRLAHDGTPDQRRDLAQRGDIRPEILYYLASDPDTEVRRNIARNHQTPRHADLLLSKDETDDVRIDVAGKIAKLAGELSSGPQDNIYRLTIEALEILARDQLVRVRQILADALLDCPTIPSHVIERLARDPEIVVAGPVLENSPVLSDEFLLQLIASSPVQGALSAIARRVALGEDLAEAIVQNGDLEAIADLLGNDSAQIREETLDRIVDQASGVPSWHKPLVHRPDLHAEAAVRIAEIVATPLLAVLKQRTDLDDRTVENIKRIILERTEKSKTDGAAMKSEVRGVNSTAPGEAPTVEKRAEKAAPTKSDGKTRPEESVVRKRVRQMYSDNQLDEHEISSALSSGGQEFVIFAIALKSKTPVEIVSRAISMRSAKAIVALCWKAGLSMRLATRVQMRLANIPPSDVLRATHSGDFPLSRDEMRWQLEFISGLATTG